MYLIKTKKQLEEQDIHELLERKQKHSELYHSEPGEARTEFRPEELPDGACFQPKAVESNVDNSDAATRIAEYIGSFSVVGKDQASRVQYVQKQLEGMRNVTNSKQVLLVISLSGVKVCSSNGQSVYMAHALKRISYATCDPDHNQFSFLAREPKGHINVQFCHAFLTKSPRAAEELNTIIGNAFKMAYAAQREKQPTFHELIEAQVAEQQAAFRESQEAAKRALQAKLTEIATPTPFSDKARTRMSMRRQTSDEGLAATLQRFNAEQGEEKEKEGNAGGARKSKLWSIFHS